jgi:MFS family permease
VAKLLVGIGIGALQATLPIYITEWAPANIRGAMVVAYGFWNALGKFLAPLLLFFADPLNYKTPILTQWAFLALMVPIFLWIPETPYYYADRDFDEKGKAAMKRVNGGVPGYDVEMEYAVVKNIIMEERRFRHDSGQADHTWKQLLLSYVECFRGNNAVRTLGAALPGCASQLTGLSFFSTYASLFFKQSGFVNPFLITTILSKYKDILPKPHRMLMV